MGKQFILLIGVIVLIPKIVLADDFTQHLISKDYVVGENSSAFMSMTTSMNKRGGIFSYICATEGEICVHVVYFPDANASTGGQYKVALSIDGGPVHTVHGYGFDDENIQAERAGFNSTGVILGEISEEIIKAFVFGRTVTFAVRLESGALEKATFSLMGYAKATATVLSLNEQRLARNQASKDREFRKALKGGPPRPDDEFQRALGHAGESRYD